MSKFKRLEKPEPDYYDGHAEDWVRRLTPTIEALVRRVNYLMAKSGYGETKEEYDARQQKEHEEAMSRMRGIMNNPDNRDQYGQWIGGLEKKKKTTSKSRKKTING